MSLSSQSMGIKDDGYFPIVLGVNLMSSGSEPKMIPKLCYQLYY